MLRFILHNWPDKYAIQILKNLRVKAGPETRLVVMEYLRETEGRDKDTIAPVAGADTGVEETLIVGGAPPKPLLPNLGHANVLTYDFDITVRSCSLFLFLVMVLTLAKDDDPIQRVGPYRQSAPSVVGVFWVGVGGGEETYS